MVLTFIATAGAAPAVGPETAASLSSGEVDWLVMSSTLFGGLALFLFGMGQMSDGLKAAVGEQMKTKINAWPVICIVVGHRSSVGLTTGCNKRD